MKSESTPFLARVSGAVSCVAALASALTASGQSRPPAPASPPLSVTAAPRDDWSFHVTPYLWVASLEVETSRPTTAPPGVDHFDTRISGGAMLAAQARYRSVGLFVDFAWLQLNTESLNPGPAFSSVNMKSDLIHTTIAMTYSLPLQGQFHADVLAGARIWSVQRDTEFRSGVLPGLSSSSDKSWVDPVIGSDVRYDLSRRWFVATKGIVGGFGVSSEIAWEIFGGVGYRFTDWCSATLGYRYLHEDYDRDRFSFSMDAHGMLLGFGFHF